MGGAAATETAQQPLTGPEPLATGPGDYRITLEVDSDLAPLQARKVSLPGACALAVAPGEAHLWAVKQALVFRWGLETLGAILAAIPARASIPADSIVHWSAML